MPARNSSRRSGSIPAICEYLLPSTTASLRLPSPIVSDALQPRASIRATSRRRPAGPRRPRRLPAWRQCGGDEARTRRGPRHGVRLAGERARRRHDAARAACSRRSRPTPRGGSPRGCRAAACSSRPRTARRRPARCSPRCCAAASSWRATAPAPTSRPASPRHSPCARRRHAELGLFECDEAALPAIAAQLAAERDRARQPLPRPARPLRRARARGRALARARRAPDPATTLVVAADDPLTASLAEGHAAVVRYGIDDPSVALPVAPHAADARFCVRCGHAYDYRAAYVGHLSDYACPSCGNARAPLDVAARAIELRGLDGTDFDLCRGDERVRVELALPGPLQRRERARGGRARGRARRAARGHRRGSRALPRRVRALPAAARRRRRARAAADQEPRRRQRGAAHPPRRRRAAACSRSTTASPTAVTSRGSGTSTGSSSRPACATWWRPARGRATPPCGSSTPASTRRAIEVVPDVAQALDRLAELCSGRHRLRPADVHGDARAAARRREPRARAALLGGGGGVRLVLCQLYPEHLSIYADRGNVQVIRRRLEWRGLELDERPLRVGEHLDPRGRRPLPRRRRPGPRPAARRAGPPAPPRGAARRRRRRARRCSPCAAATSSPGTAIVSTGRRGDAGHRAARSRDARRDRRA